MKADEVIELLAELFVVRGVARHIRSDNGLAFIGLAIGRRLGYAGVETLAIEPGSPWEKGYA